MIRDLGHRTAEQAATVLVEEFVRTGHSEARVDDVSAVRALVRRDCRHRELPVRTYGAGSIVAVDDQERHNDWLQTTEQGREHKRSSDQALALALEVVYASLLDGG
jgi:hypothetical protein